MERIFFSFLKLSADKPSTGGISTVIDTINAEILQLSETLSRWEVGSRVKVEQDENPLIPPEEGGGKNNRPVIE